MKKSIAISFSVSLLLVAGGWAWAHTRLSGLDTPLILHFSSFSGIDRIGTITDLSAQGFFGVAMVLTNTVVGMALQPKERLLSLLVAGSTLTMSCLLFILFAVIISVN